jgi:capsular exopolysaccharide synthesis family protein
MSHIFEALQKSESDRRGSSKSGSSRATELLERVEAQVTSQWQSSDVDPEIAGLPKADLEMTAWPVGTPGANESRMEFPARFSLLQPLLVDNKRLTVLADRQSPAAEAFRLLAVRMRHLRRDRKLRRVLITSTIPQEGKSLISANLACALSAGGRPKVLLVEGDLRRPSLSQLFGVKPATGLVECLRGGRELADCIYQIAGADLCILPAGTSVASAQELLQSARMAAIMEQLSSWFDWVIIDSPPVLPLADTSIWMRFAEGILLVARQGITQKRQLKRGLASIEPDKLLGAILNGASGVDASSYYYYGPKTSSTETAAD